MLDKKLEAITSHMPGWKKIQITRLAELSGMTSSELMLAVMDEFIVKKNREYMLLREAFESHGTVSSLSSQVTEDSVIENK